MPMGKGERGKPPPGAGLPGLPARPAFGPRSAISSRSRPDPIHHVSLPAAIAHYCVADYQSTCRPGTGDSWRSVACWDPIAIAAIPIATMKRSLVSPSESRQVLGALTRVFEYSKSGLRWCDQEIACNLFRVGVRSTMRSMVIAIQEGVAQCIRGRITRLRRRCERP